MSVRPFLHLHDDMYVKFIIIIIIIFIIIVVVVIGNVAILT